MIFEILLFGVLAIVLAIKLKSILGNEYDNVIKGGSGSCSKDITLLPQRAIPGCVDGVSYTSSDTYNPIIIDPGLFAPFSKIASSFPGITPGNFLNVTKDVMQTLFQAYCDGDIQTISALVKKDLSDSMIERINTSKERGQTEHIILVRICDAKIVDVSIVNNIASVSVFFVTEQIHYIIDNSGNTISGNNENVNDVCEKWTFVNDVSVNNNSPSNVWLLSSINDNTA